MSNTKQAYILLRGGGDLATGVALRLHRAGMRIVITELAQPLAVRRAVAFAEAIYEGKHTVEGVTGRFVKPGQDIPQFENQISAAVEAGEIPVLLDPNAAILRSSLSFPVVVDARLLKTEATPLSVAVPLHIGLGPGFHAGVNCQAVIETRRSHTLGRVYWEGKTQADSGQPEGDPRRVLRAPVNGVIAEKVHIGQHVEEGQAVAVVSEQRRPGVVATYPVVSPIKGVLRGLIRPGLPVTKGLKIGDVDPRDDVSACFLVSDKALSIGGAVLEAILSREDIREKVFCRQGS